MALTVKEKAKQRLAKSEYNKTVMFHPSISGCTDGGCIFQDNSNGMMTNSGCSCERELMRTEEGRKSARTIQFLRKQIREQKLIPGPEQRDMLIYAFRYALGRQTYAPYTVIEILKTSWSNLSQSDRAIYKREIKTAIDDCLAGAEFDAEAWTEILRLET